jgi:hypothetical protein
MMYLDDIILEGKVPFVLGQDVPLIFVTIATLRIRFVSVVETFAV